MNLRLWTLAAFLISAAVAAGCTSSDAPASPAPDADSQTPPPNAQPGPDAPPGHAAAQTPAPLAEGGDIQGAFDKAWTLDVHEIGARGMTVWFNLTGLQSDAPPTARVVLRLLAPDGAALQTATLGVGGDADAVEWRLTGVDIAEPGAYTLQATAETPAGALPSFGLAKYQLYAYVDG